MFRTNVITDSIRLSSQKKLEPIHSDVFGKIQIRHVIIVMIGLVSIVSNIVRGNMSIAIVAMTKPANNSTDVPDYGPRYEWSAYDQSLVLGSFFWGQMATVSFAGIFSERYGPRKVVTFAVITSAICQALTPVGAHLLWLTILLRFVTGISMGTVSPAMQSMIANWAPPDEKGKFLAAYMAASLGTIIDWSMSGFLINHLGWDYAFYVVVIILGIYAILWLSIFYDSPKEHPYISAAEREYILSKLTSSETGKRKQWPPFLSILTSIPFWALLLFHFGNAYGTYLFQTATPKYLSEVHKFDISSTGVLSSVPYLARFAFAVVFGIIGDQLLKRKTMNPNVIRKTFSIFSHFIPAAFLIGILFVGDRPYVCIAFIALALGFAGATTITALQNPHDLSPNFAATIFGFIHTTGSIPGFVAPLVVAYFTQERSTETEWRNIFLVGAGIYAGTALLFVIFGSGYVQKWNSTADVNGDDEVRGQHDESMIKAKIDPKLN